MNKTCQSLLALLGHSADAFLAYLLKHRIYKAYWLFRSNTGIRKSLYNLKKAHRRALAALVYDCASLYIAKERPTLLEIGCGWGPNLHMILSLSQSKSVSICCKGIDLSQKSIAMGNRILRRRYEYPPKLECGNIVKLMHKKDSYHADVVLADASLMYLPESDIHQVLASECIQNSAIIIICELCYTRSSKLDESLISHGNLHDYESILPIHGFTICASLSGNYWMNETWDKFGKILVFRNQEKSCRQ